MRNLVLIIFLLPSQLFAQQIILDEDVSEWVNVGVEFTDPVGDSDGIDLVSLKMTNDNRFLYFFLELSEEIDLQENNDLVLYIDTDNDLSTGIFKNEISYDFEFKFGQRTGIYHSGTGTSLSPYEIGLISSPTVTSTTFEFKIDLNSEVNGNLIFNSSEINLFIETDSGSEFLQDEGSPANYLFDVTSTFQPVTYQLSKPTSTDIRVLSYNVRRDNLFNSGLKDEYERIITAIQPDIIGFQEVYNNSGQQAAELVEEFLPSGENEEWFYGDTGTDNLIVSRYPIIREQTVEGNSAYLLDAGDRYIFTIVAHPPCCANNENRQWEIDAFMGFLRDSQNGSKFNIPDNTPIIIMGDMNLVGFRQQQITLLEGDIVNENFHGPDFNPDWDGSALDDAKPNNPGSPTTFTWYSPSSSFGAGRLDYMVYSGSVLEMLNTFSLHTRTLDPDSLLAYGLETEDTILASDHIPVVADFKFKMFTSIEENSNIDIPNGVQLHQNYPNPFNPSTTIPFSISTPSRISLSVHSINGVLISQLIDNQFFNSGDHSVVFEADQLASGVYFYRLVVDGQVQNKQMILVK